MPSSEISHILTLHILSTWPFYHTLTFPKLFHLYIAYNIPLIKIVKLLTLLFFGLLLRLVLIPVTYHVDLLSQAQWGQTINQVGPAHFYSHQTWTLSWPNHPPLTSLYYGFIYRQSPKLSLYLHRLRYLLINYFHFSPGSSLPIYLDSFDQLISPQAPFTLSYLFLLKLVPVLADIFIALLFYGLTRSLFISGLYLFLPFSWYLSSLWGQTDQFVFLLALLSFLFLPRYSFLALPLFVLSAHFKPTTLLLAPLFLIVTLRSRPRILPLLLGIFFSFYLTFQIFKPFVTTTFPDFISHTLIPKTFNRPDRLTTNAYNFWHIFSFWTDRPADQLNLAGLFLYLGLLLYLSLQSSVRFPHLPRYLFFLGFGSWLFLTNMLDRYAFFGLAASFLLLHTYPTVLPHLLVLSLIFSLNLFRLWWFPEFLSPLRHLLTFSHNLIGLPLSLANLFCYFKIIFFTKKPRFRGAYSNLLCQKKV